MNSFCVFLLVFVIYIELLPAQAEVKYEDFYPLPLRTVADCKKYAQQIFHKIVKCDVYFKTDTMYLDRQFREEFRECLLEFRNLQDFSPTVVYSIEGQTSTTEWQRKEMNDMANDYQLFVVLIPQVKFFLGPGGSLMDIFKFPNNLGPYVSLAVSEQESVGTAYPKRFFRELYGVDDFKRVPVIFLRFNAFHIYNVKEHPHHTNDLLEKASGIILWVSKENAHKVVKQKVVDHLRSLKYKRAIYLDMPGAPFLAGTGRLAPLTICLSFISLNIFL